MSTKVIARGVVGSLRLVGVTAAVAAGIAGFATVEAGAVTTDVSVVAKQDGLSRVPEQVCQKWIERGKVPDEVILKHACVVIDGPGPVDGPIIFS
jgi:uncharacterized NAD-dependent epimerase/dehydratase family protein